MNKELKALLSYIEGSKSIIIASHENPDADAIGSMLALGLTLEQMGKDITLYNPDGVPENLEFLPRSQSVSNSLELKGGAYDMAIAVDCAGLDRAGQGFVEFIESGSARKVAIIDHHKTNKSSVDVCLLDEGASSTGMMIYKILRSLSLDLTENIAVNIYATISGDTGSFRYSNTSYDTFSVAAELVKAGARPDRIAEALYENEPIRKIKLLGLVMQTLYIENGKIASIVVDRVMFNETGTQRSDTEGMVNIPRSIKGVEVAVMFREERGNNADSEQKWKISLRSKGKVDVSGVAENFGGGGHRNAAGCSLTGQIGEVKDQVFKSINEAIG